MFKVKFEKRYQNQTYTNYGITFPEEDYYCIDENIFCVADGVTRDLVGVEIRPYPKTKEEAQYIADHYPNPSGALESSKIIADNFVKYMKEKQISKETITEAVRQANKEVWQINKDRDVNYIEEDLYCSEAVGGVITEEYLYCFGIGDCYIKVYNQNKEEIFSTENDHLWMEEFEESYLKTGEYDWMNPRYRLLIRGALRNNYIVKYNGKHVGYGALTGEESAMNFVKVYQVPLKEAKYICAYSDGIMPYLVNKNEVEKTLNNPERIKKNGRERTLVIYEKEKI